MLESYLPVEWPGAAGPVGPSQGVLAPLPLAAVRLDPAGLLGAWQRRNADATIPHCLDRIEASGAVDNLRRAAGEVYRDFSGMWFADSDVYKTLEAVAWELGRDGDRPELRGALEDLAALLGRAQEPDGYLNSYVTVVRSGRRWHELRWSHELYCLGHLIQAAVAAARARVGGQLVAVARGAADLLVRRFGAGGADAVDGHPEIETALVELYRVTGHRPYLDLAGRFLDLRGRGLVGEDRFGRGYFQDHLPVRAATEVTGHAVRQLYLLAGMVDVAVETGDGTLLAAAERMWDSAFGSRTYLTGGHGSRHRDEAFGDPYELPPDRAYAETCAAIASFQWNWRLLLATGRHRYADELERVLYNGIAAATGLDGRRFCYANPLQLRTGHDGSTEDAPSRRLPWYACACCPPNLARLMASLQSYVATEDDAGVQLHLYAAGTVHSGHGRLEVTTRYPWEGRISVTVTSSVDEPWTLALRVPAWCTRSTVDGVPAEPVDGYVRLSRSWSAGGTVVLDLAMPPRLVAAHPYVDAVRGCLAIVRGPLVYCLEQADLPADTPAGTVLEDVRLDPTAPMEEVHRTAGPVPVAVSFGARITAPPSPALYAAPEPRPPDPEPVGLEAVPYFLWGNRDPGAMRVWLPTIPGKEVAP